MSTEGPPPPAAPRGRPGCLLVPARVVAEPPAAACVCSGVRVQRGGVKPVATLELFAGPSVPTKTAVALLYDEESENAYDVRLKLTKEVLTIQKQDVICVGGSHQGRNVSAATSGESRSVSEEPHEGSLKSVVQE
ncbi:hypothetical protein H8959_016722 [Pygathrix nigripes]